MRTLRRPFVCEHRSAYWHETCLKEINLRLLAAWATESGEGIDERGDGWEATRRRRKSERGGKWTSLNHFSQFPYSWQHIFSAWFHFQRTLTRSGWISVNLKQSTDYIPGGCDSRSPRLWLSSPRGRNKNSELLSLNAITLGPPSWPNVSRNFGNFFTSLTSVNKICAPCRRLLHEFE